MVRVSPFDPHASADVSIYPALVTQSELDLVVSGQGPSSRALASSGTFSLDCARHGKESFRITVLTRGAHTPARSCNGAAPRLRLSCSACGGVYPLRYQVREGSTTVTKWSLLALKSSPVTRPLHVALVASLTKSSFARPQRSISVLKTLADFNALPVTISADYNALAALELDHQDAPAWRSALSDALASPLHRAIDATPASVDFAGLAAHRLTTQVPQQLSLSARLLNHLTGRYVDGPVFVGGASSSASLLALEHAGVSDVVLPESDLTLAPSDSLTWGAPFHVAGAGSLTALSVDDPLSALIADTAIEPGRRAAMALASLAFLHFEEPNAPASRTVVVDSPIGSNSATFMIDVLKGLRSDPFAHLSTLTPLFDSALIGSNSAPSVRTLHETGTASSWSSHNVSSLLSLIGAVNSYAQGIKSGNVATQLRVAVARTELIGTPAQRQSAINAVNAELDSQLASFSVDASAITLAGPGTSIPITVISHANYTVNAVVHLVTDRLTFPHGSSAPVTLNSPTQSIRVATAKAQGSSLTLQVLLTTPNGQVVLARAAIQVRIAGTSVVGYVLTFASLFVLALWWWRTIRRRPKGRHAR